MIKDKVYEIIKSYSADSFDSDTLLLAESTGANLGLDEIDIEEIIMDIEDEFDIVVNSESSENWKTVGDIVMYVQDEKGVENNQFRLF